MTLTNDQKLLITGAVLVAVTVWYLKGKAVEVAQDVGQAVNPVNPDNVFNRGFEAIWQSVSDSRSFGSWLADKLHGQDYDLGG